MNIIWLYIKMAYPLESLFKVYSLCCLYPQPTPWMCRIRVGQYSCYQEPGRNIRSSIDVGKIKCLNITWTDNVHIIHYTQKRAGIADIHCRFYWYL